MGVFKPATLDTNPVGRVGAGALVPPWQCHMSQLLEKQQLTPLGDKNFNLLPSCSKFLHNGVIVLCVVHHLDQTGQQSPPKESAIHIKFYLCLPWLTEGQGYKWGCGVWEGAIENGVGLFEVSLPLLVTRLETRRTSPSGWPMSEGCVSL